GRNDGLVDHDRRPLYPEHPWDREPPDVPVDDPHAMAPASQGDGEVGADRGLADPALSGRDGDYPGAVAGLAYLRARLGAHLLHHLVAPGVVHHLVFDRDATSDCLLDGLVEDGERRMVRHGHPNRDRVGPEAFGGDGFHETQLAERPAE